MEPQTDLILRLFDIGALKFGEYKLKSGLTSPVYVDLRVIISYPLVMQQVSDAVWNVSKVNQMSCDNVCGVPYTALPIATCISVQQNVPMIIKRKEAKDYGTKKMVEGVFKTNDNCLIIEDVVTTGSSVRETAECLRDHGLAVSNAIVLLDRDQGGKQELVKHGIKLASCFTLPQVLKVLHDNKKLDKAVVDKVNAFLSANQMHHKSSGDSEGASNFSIFTNSQRVDREVKTYNSVPRKTITSFAERSKLCKNPICIKLMNIIESKKSNLCLSADVDSAEELLELAKSVGPYICCIKTHVDTLSHFDYNYMARLQLLAQELNFVVFEDRKFADIGNTVKSQLTGGVYKIAQWADIINAHALPGPGIIKGLIEGAKLAQSELGCLLIAQMSSKDNLLGEMYTKETVRMASNFEEFVVGFISTSRVSTNPAHLHFTPGVRLQPGTDSLGQQYLTPLEVVANRGSDIIIVGRGILQSNNRVQAARAFRDAAWGAYQSRANQRY